MDQSIVNNHKMVYDKIEELITILNKEGIDYYLAGALSSFINYGIESNRCHEDINIHINERDLGKFENVCTELNIHYIDDRLSSPRVLNDGISYGEHDVKAIFGDSGFHIGVFCFERLADGTIISKIYYHNDDNSPCCREEIYSSNLAKIIFKKSPVEFRGNLVYLVAPEYIFYIKQKTNTEKDKKDMECFQDKINMEVLGEIRRLMRTDCFVQCTPVFSLPPLSKLNLKKIENDNTELSQMITGSSDNNIAEDNSDVTLGSKQSESGFAKKHSLILILAFTIIILLIGFVVYQLIK